MSDFICNIWKVEHGSAAFLRTPSNSSVNSRTVLFDAGCSDDFALAKHLSKEWGLSRQNRLDWLIISHPDRDHIQDLPSVHSLLYPRVLSRNQSIPECAIYPDGMQNLSEPLKTYKEMHETYNQPVGDDLKNPPTSNWGGVLIKTFSSNLSHVEGCPESKLKNNLSVLSYVRYDQVEIIFPGDLEPLGWEALLNNTDILTHMGNVEIRILVASHHGRKSGIRNADETVYDRFLKAMKPHLVVMSDKWGSENTDPEAYRPYCLGFNVYNRAESKYEFMKVITTKTNNFVSVQYHNGKPYVVIP